MKHITRLLSLLTLVSAALFLSNCGSDGGDDKSAEEQQLDKLKFAWTLQGETATFNGGSSNEEREFPGMVLNLSGTYAAGAEYTYSVDVTEDVDASPWPATGKWKFNPANLTNEIIRLDSKLGETDITMGYALTGGDKILTITFEFDGAGYALNGRSTSVEGEWTFVFTRP